MASIEEIRSQIAAANDKGTQGMGGLQGAKDEYEGMRALALAALDGSNQAEAAEALSMINRVIDFIEQAQGAAQAGIQSLEGVGARL
jgi:hypothetical protein